jgi:hypothetical protein
MLMKATSVKLPEGLAARIEAEARKRGMSKSDVIRDRLERAPEHASTSHLDEIAHLIGSVVDDLPEDLSARAKYYVQKAIRARKGAG